MALQATPSNPFLDWIAKTFGEAEGFVRPAPAWKPPALGGRGTGDAGSLKELLGNLFGDQLGNAQRFTSDISHGAPILQRASPGLSSSVPQFASHLVEQPVSNGMPPALAERAGLNVPKARQSRAWEALDTLSSIPIATAAKAGSLAVPALKAAGGALGAGAIRLGGDPGFVLSHAFRAGESPKYVNSGAYMNADATGAGLSTAVTYNKGNQFSPSAPAVVFGADAIHPEDYKAAYHTNRDGYFENPVGTVYDPAQDAQVFDPGTHTAKVKKLQDKSEAYFGTRDTRLTQLMPTTGGVENGLKIIAPPNFRTMADYELSDMGGGVLKPYSSSKETEVWHKMQHFRKAANIHSEQDVINLYRRMNKGETLTPDEKELLYWSARQRSGFSELKIHDPIPIHTNSSAIYLPDSFHSSLTQLEPWRDAGFPMVAEQELSALGKNMSDLAPPDGRIWTPPRLSKNAGSAYADFLDWIDKTPGDVPTSPHYTGKPKVFLPSNKPPVFPTEFELPTHENWKSHTIPSLDNKALPPKLAPAEGELGSFFADLAAKEEAKAAATLPKGPTATLDNLTMNWGAPALPPKAASGWTKPPVTPIADQTLVPSYWTDSTTKPVSIAQAAKWGKTDIDNLLDSFSHVNKGKTLSDFIQATPEQWNDFGTAVSKTIGKGGPSVNMLPTSLYEWLHTNAKPSAAAQKMAAPVKSPSHLDVHTIVDEWKDWQPPKLGGGVPPKLPPAKAAAPAVPSTPSHVGKDGNWFAERLMNSEKGYEAIMREDFGISPAKTKELYGKWGSSNDTMGDILAKHFAAPAPATKSIVPPANNALSVPALPKAAPTSKTPLSSLIGKSSAEIQAAYPQGTNPPMLSSISGPKPSIHPAMDDAGKPVTIKSPTQTSVGSNWSKMHITAHWGVQDPFPIDKLNGVRFESWTPPSDWSNMPHVPGGAYGGQAVTQKVNADPAYVKATGSGIIMREADGRIWLVRPTNQFGGKEYAIPKGRLDPTFQGSAKSNAIKETYEETGLGSSISDYLGTFKNSTGGGNAIFEGKRIGGHPKDMGWESQGLTLIKPQEALKLMNPKDPDYAIVKAFADKHAPAVQNLSVPVKLDSGNGGPITLPTTSYKKVGEKPGGSNPGGIYTDNDTGEKYLFKHPPSIEHAKDEQLAAFLYNAAGIKVPSVRAGVFDAKPTSRVDWENGLKSMSLNEMASSSHIRKGFLVDSWLANWDVVGLTDDNIMRNGFGDPTRIDLGGTLRWRAQGGPKGDKWGDSPQEVMTFMKESLNPKTAKLFANLTRREAEDALYHLKSVGLTKIKVGVERAYGPGPEADAMISTLTKRREALLSLGVDGVMAATKK